jgi:hypothetical protein
MVYRMQFSEQNALVLQAIIKNRNDRQHDEEFSKNLVPLGKRAIMFEQFQEKRERKVAQVFPILISIFLVKNSTTFGFQF